MKSKLDAEKISSDSHRASPSAIDRRELIKIGAGVVATTLAGQAARAAEAPAAQDAVDQGKGAGAQSKNAGKPVGGVNWKYVKTGPGYKNDAGRISGNGPMDETSRQLVSWASSFSEAKLTAPVLKGMSMVMLDTMAALLAGFESEPARIGARLGKTIRSDFKSTIFGYGVVTSPEIAAFTNSAMIRHCDYNDGGPPGGHDSDIIPGILAIGEALHSTGPQILTAIAMSYEVLNALQESIKGKSHGWDSMFDGIGTALGVGKLLGLNEDKLANAVSIALVPHMPLFVAHVGALSHWKGVHSPMSVRDGIYAALLANGGMTGPAQPFEERGGLWDSVTGPCNPLKLPISSDGRLIVEYHRYKRFPAELNSQAILVDAIPAIRQWTKVEDIASIEMEVPFGVLQEICDPPKWDPQNRETADHSLPYLVAVGLTDGEVYLSSFTPDRYRDDAGLRSLMNKTTCTGNPDFGLDRSRITIRKKSGEQLVRDVLKDKPVTYDEVLAKFDRVCAYKQVSTEQRDRARATWTNLQSVHDIAEPIREMANFGKPAPL